MKCVALSLILSLTAWAEDCKVLVDGAGCRTRQLAIARVFENMPEVTQVEVLPLAEAPALNQRYFVLRCAGKAPSREQLIEALGRREKFYHVIAVTPVPQENHTPAAR
jgi:hypothetical protein